MNDRAIKTWRAWLAVALMVCAVPLAADTHEARPNVLFIAVDDLKPLAGAYGVPTVRTPNLDRLAESSVVFTRAYTQYPVCGPSRASLLTGLRPELSGVLDLKTRMRDVHPDILTLPQYFRNEGYQTAAVGKIFDPRNVDSRDEDDPASWTIPYRQSFPDADRKLDVNYAVRSIEAPAGRFIDGAINARGIKLLKEMAADSRPFFLAVGYKKPHLPFAAPRRYFDLYDRELFALEEWQQAPQGSDASFILMGNNELRNYVSGSEYDGSAGEYAEKGITPEQQRELLHGYHAAVSFIDALLGELLEALAATGKEDNTIVVLWGDHGFHLGDHGMWGKHTTMEQANRVPLLIRVPGMASGHSASLVELMDLFPTLVELAGLPSLQHLQGDSLLPFLRDPSVETKDVAISQYKRKGAYGYSLRTDRYRYTEWVMPDGEVAYRDLYDLQADPMETRNIAKMAENADLLDSLAALLRQAGDGLERLRATVR
jgi:arylsulfatase A-like enzyme